MLPTQGYFKEVECPYYVFSVKGSCNRPHCHFKHSRRDTDYDFSEPPVVEEQIPDQNELNEQQDEDITPEDSEEEEINTPEDNEESSNDQNKQHEPDKEEIEEPKVEDPGGGEESEEEQELDEELEEDQVNTELDIEENLLKFKKALMESIKKVIESYHKIFCKNINTKDFNQLIDEFIKNIINYDEIESVELKKFTYNPTPIIELRKQEKRIKTQLPYIPECVKVNQPVVNEALDIDSDLKFLEDLIQNDSLFSSNDNQNENKEDSGKIVNKKSDNDNKKDDSKSKDKKVESSKDKSSRDKHKSSHSKSHDLSSSSKDKASSSSSKEKHKSSSESSHKRSSSSSKDPRSHSSSSNGRTSSSSSSSKHKRSRSKSHSSTHSSSESKSKKSKHSSSSNSEKKKSESTNTIVISSESSEEDVDSDNLDIYSNIDVNDDQDNGENQEINENADSKKKNNTKEENYDEPDYIRKKKKQRVAHVDIFGVPSNPQPVSNRAKVLNPNERFKQIQEKYKGLNRNSLPSHTPDSVKIASVPNVNSILTAKKTITQPPAPLSINKNSLLMNDILKRTELKKTIAQTSKKTNRVAHVPSSGTTATKPLIQVDCKTGTRIPLVVRQSCLDRIFSLYSKYVPPDLAASRSLQVESETYEKCHAAKSYQNSIANSILRIRKEQSGFFMGSKPQR